MPRPTPEPVLSRRALNRATLQRQLLLERSTLAIPAAVERLAGLQHQTPNAPYFALHARLSHFDAAALTTLMTRRRLVRCAAMRSTLHLLSARDLLAWRRALDPTLRRALLASHGRHLKGLDLDAVAAAGRALLCAQPHTLGQLGQALAARWAGHDANALAVAVRCTEALVHVPPAGTWNSFRNALLLPADAWLGRPLEADAAPDAMVLRYLAAFGPASAADIATWSGLGALAEVLQRLAPRLRRYRDDDGRLLYDLRRTSLPDADTPAPVRLLGEFDNLVLSHADRRRLLADEHRPQVMSINGLVRPCVLVDGEVQGTWKLDRAGREATLVVTPFRRLRPAERAAVQAEAQRTLAFAAVESARHRIRITKASS
ncbi:MAG: AlkZ family DNA glycosylase [Rhizobacter sp.]|nr:AlkZ family DNA glycosylase [Rhizobacter sp.]